MVKGLTILLFAALAPAAYASDVTAPPAIKPTGTAAVVAAGPDNQMNPHVSGTLVTYMSQTEGRIHYVNLTDNSDNAIPGPDGTWDSLADVSGNTIVFRRSTLGWQTICAFDITSRTTRELDPPAEGQFTYRVYPSIGGRIVAWQDRLSPTTYDDIVVFDLDTNVLTRLTSDDGGYNRVPSVSEDGATVVWTKQTDYSVNQLWQATRNADGTWTTKQLTTTAGFIFSQPATNGEIVVYQTAPDSGYYTDLRIQPVGGGTETRILIPGMKSPCRVSGHLIVFDSWMWGYPADIYAYDVETNVLYQITDSTQSESLTDVSVGADGTARVVWNVDNGDDALDVRALTFHLGQTYVVQPLFDQQRSYKFGGVAPIKLQVLGADGNNASSADLVVSATAVVPVGSETPSDVLDAGNANPDANFRYDATLGGYIFNLSTKNLAPGTWELQFRIGSDSAPYSVRFSLR